MILHRYHNHQTIHGFASALAMKLGCLSLHDTNDPEVDILAELLSRIGIDDSIQELS